MSLLYPNLIGGFVAVMWCCDVSAATLCNCRDTYTTMETAQSQCYNPSGCTTNIRVGACLTSEVLAYTTNISGDKDRLVLSCTSCWSGYTLTEDKVYNPVMEAEQRQSESACYSFPGLKYCKIDSSPAGCPLSCTMNSKWVAKGTGYEEYHLFSCNATGACVESVTEYRCASNYYGTTSNGTSGCTACPSGKYSAAGTTTASGCKSSCGSGSYWNGSTCTACPNPYEYMTPDDGGELQVGWSEDFGTGINGCSAWVDANSVHDRSGTFVVYDSPQTGAPDCQW